MLPKRPKAFRTSLVLLGGIYWWVVGYFTPWWLRLVGYIVGRDRYNHIEQAWLLRFGNSLHGATIIFAFSAALSLIFYWIAIVPLYWLWHSCHLLHRLRQQQPKQPTNGGTAH